MNTEDYIAQLKKNGFVVISKVIAEDRLLALRNLTDRIMAYADRGLEDPFAPYYLPHRSDQGVLYDLFHRHPEFQEAARLPQMLDVLEGVLGPNIFLYENSLVSKPKGRSNGVPWHQDFMSRPDEPKKYITWIALDDVRVENGALRVIPGSHLNGYVPYHVVPGETHHTRANPDTVDESQAVHVEMDAGSGFIFDCQILHGSDEVHADSPRRAFRVSYQGFEQIYTPRATPIVVRGGDPEDLGRLFPNKPIAPRKRSATIRALNKIGRVLARV
tara:strand:+ start:5882 stop:6700 length:819 start_codon:yes stop_codon:yes gene_type:complete